MTDAMAEEPPAAPPAEPPAPPVAGEPPAAGPAPEAPHPGAYEVDVEVGGRLYEFRLLQVTALAQLELRQSTGLTVSDLLGMRIADGGWSLETVGLLVFLALRSAGEEVSVVDVLGAITWATPWRVVRDPDSQ